MSRELSKSDIIERSIRTTYKKRIWNPFIEAIKKYQLIQKDDKIAVCISGGKDSMLLAKLLQMLQKHTEVPFTLKFVSMDPGYSNINRQQIITNAEILSIPIEFFETDIFDVVNKTEKSPCYLCARMRRGYLYKAAQNMGCNKIAVGHHFDDVIETTLMGMLYGSQLQAMLPKLHSKNFDKMELIRPLYCVHEDSIIAWKNYHKLNFLQCACKVTEQREDDNKVITSKRLETKMLIKELKKTNKNVDKCIFNSIHNVNLDTLIGYKFNDVKKSFLDSYNNTEK